MAASASLTISGSVTGLPSGTKTLSGTITSAAAVGEVTDVTLASGDNTIDVPTGATAVLITPPSNNAVTLKLKGAGGDTGVVIAPTGSVSSPVLIPIGTGQTTLIINAASATSGTTEFSFI